MTELKSIKWDGKTVTKPGMYAGIGMDLYHDGKICDGPSVSSSGLRKLFAKSPAHFYDTWAGNPNRTVDADKPHFALGRALHHLMLGEPFFAKLYIQRPDDLEDEHGEVKPWHGSRTVCKDWLKARAKEGRTVLTTDDIFNLRGMAEQLGHQPIVRHGGLNGMIERSIFWKDKDTGVWLKSRPDSIPASSHDFVDLKSTRSVLWEDVRKAIYDYGYYQQGGLIRAAARELGIKSPTFTLVFVESERPWATRIVTPKDPDLDRGEKANRMALDAIAACIKAKRWPGPGGDREDAEDIEMSDHHQKKIDDRLKFGIPN